MAAVAAKHKYTYRSRAKFWVHLVLMIGSILMIFPFIWTILTSFKTQGEAIMIPPIFFPSHWNFDSYKEVLRTLPFDALYLMLSSLNQLNTIFALVFPGLVSAFGTFFLRQFYMSLPNDLAEAAKLDGCNVMQTFVWVMAPLTKTAVMALAVFTALFAYSDMMWPLIVNMNIDKMTLAAGISSLQGQHSTNYPVMMAGSALAMIPMLAIYLIFQKQFIEGIALTGTKA